MRFKRYRTRTPRPITPRRLSAAKRALQRERDKFPLLTDWVAQQQPTPEGRLDHFQSVEARRIESTRQNRADNWKRARRLLRLLPSEIRQAILDKWNNHSMPADPAYLGDLIWTTISHQVEDGSLNIPDDLNPKKRIEKMLEELRERRRLEFEAARKRGAGTAPTGLSRQERA